MAKQRQLSALFLCLTLTLILLLSSVYITHALGHECAEAGCEVCQAAVQIEKLLKSFSGLILKTLILMFPALRLISLLLPPWHIFSKADTLVSRKVRLND